MHAGKRGREALVVSFEVAVNCDAYLFIPCGEVGAFIADPLDQNFVSELILALQRALTE